MIATTATPCGFNSAAHVSGNRLCATLTAWESGFAPPPRTSFSVTSTISPRFAGIIAGAACFAVMMCDGSP